MCSFENGCWYIKKEFWDAVEVIKCLRYCNGRVCVRGTNVLEGITALDVLNAVFMRLLSGSHV